MSRKKGRGTRPTSPDTAYTVRCYSVPEVSAIIGVSERVLMSWARQGSIPYPIGHGTAALWTAEDVHLIQSGIALPGTYLVARSPMLRERVEQLRAAARRLHQSADVGRARPARVPHLQRSKGGAR